MIATVISGGARFDAVDVFRAQYRLAELKAVVARLFARMEVLVLPTIGTTFTVPEVLEIIPYVHQARSLHPLRQPAGPVRDCRPGGQYP